MIPDENKRHFLKWFIQEYQLKRKESLWILNYLLTHDFLLSRIHFTEDAKAYPYGLKMATKEAEGEDFSFYHLGEEESDPEKAFQEIRCNWRNHYYIELKGPHIVEALVYFNLLEACPEEKSHQEERYEQLMTDWRKDILLDRLKQEMDLALSTKDYRRLESIRQQIISLKNGGRHED